jgi:5-(carboxyamino)imidazole ribonucleotide synthase
MKIGVIGGGQLAWMIAESAASLGINLIVQTPNPDDPALSIVTDKILAKIDDFSATAALAKRCDIITFENEFVDVIALENLAQNGVIFRPKLSTLSQILDKHQQLQSLKKLGLPTPKFSLINEDLIENNRLIKTYPVVLKSRRHGYDGQGTFIIKNREDLEKIGKKIGWYSLLLQEYVPFIKELAVIAVRSISGEIAIYPIVETIQINQVCLQVTTPAAISQEIAEKINSIAQQLLEGLDLIGVCGIELFLTKDNQILINEIAPRTHNSGHLTINACQTSQFEQHLRAISGLPLGSTALKYQGAVMVNLLGMQSETNDYIEKRQKLAEIPNSHLYWYGKNQSRPGRKMGHITIVLPDQEPRNISEWAKITTQKVQSIWQN